jgi:hypothetical protein
MRPGAKSRVAAIALSAGLLAAAASPTSALTAPDLPGSVRRLLEPAVVIPHLPAGGDDALVRAAGALGAALGTPVDAGPAIAAAHLPAGIAGRLAGLLDGLRACHLAVEPARVAWRAGRAAPPATVEALRRCAAPLQSLALETGTYLRAVAAAGDAVDLWPVLRYTPGRSDDRYVHDYALLVDQGGNDTYLNNAGGNMLDLQRGPDGSAALKKEPARGCHTFGLDYPGECVSAVAVLIDAAGDDTYGAFEAPDPADDGFCTADPVVRRIVTGGASFAGVGLLIDSAGNDHYAGKTAALGSGHFAGVGILRDEAGNDTYTALRNSEGYALGSGVGILRDDAGNDVYDYYTAAPLDPTAPFQRPGAGGVVDDTGLCDNLPRQMQGTAQTAGSYGILHDLGGADRYRGAPLIKQPFPPVDTVHGSQGWGGTGGVGMLLDEGGRDTYEGVPGHGDDRMQGPGPDSTGLFEDENSGTR